MINYIILGTLQGIFEWVPISSEGIVALMSQFLLINENPIQIALFLHLGTLLAVIIYFRKEWGKVLFLKDLKLARFLIISTLVSLMVGFPLYKMVRDIAIGRGLLLIMGIGLLFTAFFQKLRRSLKIGFDKLAVLSGLLQGLAVIPGLSRSGATIFGLSLGGLSPKETLKISYMMSAPVVLTSGFYILFKNPTFLVEGWISCIFSFLIGILTLDFLIKVSQKINFFNFALIFSLLCFLGALI